MVEFYRAKRTYMRRSSGNGTALASRRALAVYRDER